MMSTIIFVLVVNICSVAVPPIEKMSPVLPEYTGILVLPCI